MIAAAIKCVVKVLYDNNLNSNFTPYEVAKQLGDTFGFVLGRDFTMQDIDDEMSKYN